MTKVDLVSITGSPQVDGWAYVFTSQEQDLTCSLSIKGKNAKNIGHEVIELINNAHLNKISQLHNLLLDILSKLRELEAQPQIALLWLPAQTSATDDPLADNPQTQTDLQSNDQLVLAVYQGKVILKRNNKVGVVIKSEQTAQLIQGSVQDGDELILMTQQATQLEQSVRQLFKQSLPHNEIKTQLKRKIEMLIDSSLTAMALTKVKHESIILGASKSFLFHVGKKGMTGSQDFPESVTNNSKANDIELDNKESGLDGSLAESEDLTLEKEIQEDQEKPDLKVKINLESINKIARLIGKTAKKGVVVFFQTVKNLLNTASSQVKKKTDLGPEGLESQDCEPVIQSDKFSQKAGSVPNNETFHEKSLKKIFSSSKKKLNPTQTSTKNKFKKKLLRFPFDRAVYLERKTSKKTFKFLSVLLIIIMILGGSALYIKKIYQNQQKQAQTALADAHQLLLEASQIMNQDIVLARDKTAEAITIIISEQKKLAGNRFTKKYLDQELQQAHDFFAEISGIIEVSQLEIFFDLREQVPNFITSEVAINNTAIFFLDREQKQLTTLNLQTKAFFLVDLPEGVAKDITASDEQLYLLGNGITSLTVNPQSAEEGFKELKSEGDSDREAIMIDFFESYLYVFNPHKRNIYRYIVRSDGLSEPIGWLTNKQGLKFDQVTSMAVDGFIWLVDSTGKIFKLERGEPVEFDISGLEEEFEGSARLFADADTQYLYVLEPDKKRLVVLSTNGDFIKQITHPSLASATHLVVNEQLGLGFAVSGSIVFAVPIE